MRNLQRCRIKSCNHRSGQCTRKASRQSRRRTGGNAHKLYILNYLATLTLPVRVVLASGNADGLSSQEVITTHSVSIHALRQAWDVDEEVDERG